MARATLNYMVFLLQDRRETGHRRTHGGSRNDRGTGGHTGDPRDTRGTGGHTGTGGVGGDVKGTGGNNRGSERAKAKGIQHSRHAFYWLRS
jgi:hypothetical protein